MNNNQVRELIDQADITTANITNEELELLHKHLGQSLAKSDCFRNSFRMNKLSDPKFMTCKSDYFNGREAVSFNRDGFIGFAGWASSNNVEPILQGVCNWLKELEKDINDTYKQRIHQTARRIGNG